MTPEEILTLARELETATSPDRRLDGRIAEAVAEEMGSREPGLSEEVWPGRPRSAPWFTHLRDARLEIESDGYWKIEGPARYLNIPSPIPNYWCAGLTLWSSTHSEFRTFRAWGATEALARRAAALRAVAARHARRLEELSKPSLEQMD